MNSYFASNPSEDSALLYALAVGAAIWFGAYLWKQYNKPNKKLPPLDDKKRNSQYHDDE